MGPPMTAEALALRDEVVDAIGAAVSAGRQPDRGAITRQFRSRAAPTTLGRWIDAALAECLPHNPEAGPAPNCGEECGGSGEAGGAGGDRLDPDEKDTTAVRTPGGPSSAQKDPMTPAGAVTPGWSDPELRRLDFWRHCQPDQPSRAAAVRLLALAALRLPAQA